MAHQVQDAPEDTEAHNQTRTRKTKRRFISIPVSCSSPVPALSTHLGVSADGFLALDAGVGADLVEALDAAVAPLLLHVLLALQRVAAVEAVEALRHGAHGVTARPCERNQRELTALNPSSCSSFLALCT